MRTAERPRAPGERNGNAQLSDADVELMRELFESEEHIAKGKRFWTYNRLAEKFEISRRQVANIVGYRQRV